MGGSPYSFSKKGWIRKGYELCRNESGGLSRDFWLCQPLAYEGGAFAPPPSFRPWSQKMMAYPLEVGERPDGHGIRPHSLKVTTIAALMTDVDKGQSNLSHLAIQGNYRAFRAHDMSKANSRNLAQQQLSVSDFAQSAFRKNDSL